MKMFAVRAALCVCAFVLGAPVAMADGGILKQSVMNLGLLGGGSSSGSSSSSSSGSSGGATTRLDSITFCGTSVANSTTTCPSSAPANDSDTSGFWNPVDILYTSTATRAVIFLHGAGGTNYGAINDLGLSSVDMQPSASDIDFAYLSANNIIAVFPQGQGFHQLGVLTTSATWNNWAMDSGQDDKTMLEALAAYVKNTYGVQSVYLAGHSNGGIMVNRMWCESPATFDGYVSLAGPASEHYSTPGNACAPSPQSEVKPYFGIIGAQDTVMCDNGNTSNAGLDNPDRGCNSAANWNSTTWTINSQYILGFISSSIVNSVLISEPLQQVSRAQLMCGETTLTPDPAASNSQSTVWSNCGGSLKLQQVVEANHPISYAHNLCPLLSSGSCSLEVASGSGAAASTGLLELIVDFLDSIGQ